MSGGAFFDTDNCANSMRPLSYAGFWMRQATLVYAAVSFPSPEERNLLCGPFDVRHVSSAGCCSVRATRVASHGVISPKGGCASIA
jgi:hypothetical protein